MLVVPDGFDSMEEFASCARDVEGVSGWVVAESMDIREQRLFECQVCRMQRIGTWQSTVCSACAQAWLIEAALRVKAKRFSNISGSEGE